MKFEKLYNLLENDENINKFGSGNPKESDLEGKPKYPEMMEINGVQLWYVNTSGGLVFKEIELIEMGLNEIPEELKSIGSYQVDGTFDISYNNISNLDGSPEIVYGDCFLSHNNLKTLSNAPHTNENFYCSNNELVSLKGCPKKVKYFNCSNNDLMTLEDGPKYVVKDYIVKNNPGDFTEKDVANNTLVLGNIEV